MSDPPAAPDSPGRPADDSDAAAGAPTESADAPADRPDAGQLACIDVGEDETLLYDPEAPERWLRSSRSVGVAAMV